MKTLFLLLFSVAALSTGCTLNDGFARPNSESLSSDMVHFGIYIELLPDPSLNYDEQCAQGHALRLKSRAGFDISFYQIITAPSGESKVRSGTTNKEGNYNAHDLTPGTYRVIATDAHGEAQELVVTPPMGKITRLTFSFD
ncbi:MAG TPA: carboxypeptidase-like regulatory domain-containing protein [Saprospiraceae bacterium]|nr:carboxypeptidase-like regulatory domain-containing protein [Saprospiraceae bacterium]